MNELISKFKLIRTANTQHQIINYLRDLIISGQLEGGIKFPSTALLAEKWGAPMATIQKAMTQLVKEGLLTRRPRVGTFVRQKRECLSRIGVYLPGNTLDRSRLTFLYELVSQLRQIMTDRGYESQFWIDSRPESESTLPWPELLAAAQTQRFQALIVPCLDDQRYEWLHKMPVPVTFGGSLPLSNAVISDKAQLAEIGLRELSQLGCKSVGLFTVLSPYGHSTKIKPVNEDRRFFHRFKQVSKSLGLKTQNSWTYIPDKGEYINELHAEEFGYQSIHKLWRKKERPDGILVFTDVMARGVIMGLLELHVDIPSQLKLALHRNYEIGLHCPFATSFINESIAARAESMIQMAECQFKGESVKIIRMPYTITRQQTIDQER